MMQKRKLRKQSALFYENTHIMIHPSPNIIYDKLIMHSVYSPPRQQYLSMMYSMLPTVAGLCVLPVVVDERTIVILTMKEYRLFPIIIAVTCSFGSGGGCRWCDDNRVL